MRNCLAPKTFLLLLFVSSVCSNANPEEAFLSPAGTVLQFSVSAVYRSSSGAKQFEVAAEPVKVVVLQTASLTIQAERLLTVSLSGTNAVIPISVRNTGNGPDHFALTASGQGWAVRFVPADNTQDQDSLPPVDSVETPVLSPGESFRFAVSVTVPASLDSDVRRSIEVKAASAFDPNQQSTASFAVVGLANPLLGDVNGDGRLGIADVTTAVRIAFKLLTPSPMQVRAADVAPPASPDGLVTIGDVVGILRMVMGLESK
ncbi:MAG: hypothetical protein ACP5R4_09960 [Armatimonadota bacterium]